MIQEIDFKILDWIQENLRCGFLDWLAPKLTLFGELGIFWIVVAAVFIYFKQYRRCGIEMCCGMLTSLLVGNVLLKNIVARDRPCWINEAVNLIVSVPTDYSFPSGHTLICFIPATIIMMRDKRLGIPAYIISVLVAFSRLYLYVHFPTDVLFGMVIGIMIGFVISKLSPKVYKLREETTDNREDSLAPKITE